MKIEKNNSIKAVYSYDATGLEGSPEGVIFAEKVEDIVEAIKHATKDKKIIVPRGGGTGFVGATVPPKNSIVLSLEKMDKIIDIDEKNLFVEVEAGVVTGKLQRVLESIGYFYPPDPSSLDSCTIGGNISTNAGGPRAVKYGVTKNYVCGIEAVTGKGELYIDKRKVRKKSVGYNINDLFVGSEGTLGIVYRCLLRILKKPESRTLVLALLKSLYEAGKKIEEILKGIQGTSALEIMDITSISAVRKYRSLDIPQEVEAILLIEIDGYEKTVKMELERLKKLLGDTEIRIAESEEEEDKIWTIRRAISPSIKEIAPKKINEDVTVPISKLAEALVTYKKLGEKYGIPVVSFGHAGDGNIHVNVMLDDMKEKQVYRAEKLVFEIFSETIRLGGVLSGEHGIGITKKKYLPLQVDKNTVNLWKEVKKIFDPENILNPHVIF
jgi:glycolate oxidase